MKTIENKKIEIIKGQPTCYVSLIRDALNMPPQGGFSVTEMRKRMEIDIKITSDKMKELKVEDAEYLVIQECVKNMRWGVMSKEICDFCDYLKIKE